MKIELAPGAAKNAVADQAIAVAAMMNRVSACLAEGKVKDAYQAMNYELVDTFGTNLETLVNETDP